MAVEKGIDTELPVGTVQAEQVQITETPLKEGQVELDDGSMIVGDVSEEMLMESMPQIPFDGNLADIIEESELNTISTDLVGEIEDDKTSREEWEESYQDGLSLLGMRYEERSQPFEGASGVVHPLLAESVTQFQAQAYRELLPANGPVQCQIIGDENLETMAQAKRVKDFMNYQITYEMEEYDPELDQMLFYLPITGSTFKKIYFDPLLQRAVSKFVHAEDIIVPYTATDLATANRITHVVRMDRNEVLKLQLSGFYRDIDLPSSGYASSDYTDVNTTIDEVGGMKPSGTSEELILYEIHTNLDLPGFEDVDVKGETTELKLPYIVTILEKSGDILSIRRNYEEQDVMRRRKEYFVHYKFLPGLGFYGFGLTHMIGGLSQAATSLLRQLIDAGTLSNLPAGFKARGARIRDEDEPLAPGEFRDIDVAGMDIRSSLMALPFKEPSQTLFALLGTLVDSGRRFASIADMKVAEMGGETPVGTTMAIMERGTKVMSAIHKRLHYSQKTEFKLLANVFAKFMAPMYPYQIPGAPPQIKVADFDDKIDVIPVSDPNIFSMSQRIALAQTQLQLVQSNPQIHGNEMGLYQAYRRMYEALGVTNVDTILPQPPQPMPTNPGKENQEAMRGKPLQAFPEQNHQAHIEAHTAIIATPVAQANASIVMTLQGHIQEHIGFMAEQMAQAEITSNMPQEELVLLQQSPQGMQKLQNDIAGRAAELIGELTEQYSQAITPPAQPDPLVAIRQQELALRGAEIQRKAQEFEQQQAQEREKDMADMSLDQQKLNLNEAALREKSRIAEERLRTQKELTVFKEQNKR